MRESSVYVIIFLHDKSPIRAYNIAALRLTEEVVDGRAEVTEVAVGSAEVEEAVGTTDVTEETVDEPAEATAWTGANRTNLSDRDSHYTLT